MTEVFNNKEMKGEYIAPTRRVEMRELSLLCRSVGAFDFLVSLFLLRWVCYMYALSLLVVAAVGRS